MAFKTYLVGGAVRDKLLGLPIKEKDWVVVGATVDDLLQQGYKCVGKDFPVFLHPESKEEYALARTERKTAPGYAGFSFDSSSQVTLEEDLARRDLTINAIAEDVNGDLIDPYKGQQDLQRKIFRHVSSAFIEDPVRILRLARFTARFAHLGFSTAEETWQFMSSMVKAGEVAALVPERVWQEWHKALKEKDPGMFFQVLQNCGALAILFPEIEKHYQAVLQYLITLKADDEKLRFAAIMQALNRGEIINLCQYLAVPNTYKQLALLAKDNFSLLKKTDNAENCLQLLESIDAFRRTNNLDGFLSLAIELNYKKSLIENVKVAFKIAKMVNAKSFLQQGISGKALGEVIRAERLKQIEQYFSTF